MHFPALQEIYSSCCTNGDFEVLSLGTVVGSPVARLGEALHDRDFDLRGVIRLRWRLAKGLREGSHTSTNLVGGSFIAGLSVRMVPNNMGVGIYLRARAERCARRSPVRRLRSGVRTNSPLAPPSSRPARATSWPRASSPQPRGTPVSGPLAHRQRKPRCAPTRRHSR